jgi:cation transport ATPase
MRAGAQPETKRDLIDEWWLVGRKVAMEGYGVSHARALAVAEVGMIAIGKRADVALESACRP